MASQQTYTKEGFREFNLARPTDFICVTFVIVGPKRVTGSGSLQRLLSPFSSAVWTGLFAIVLALFAMLEAVLHIHRALGAFPGDSMKSHTHFLTVAQLLNPAIGQDGIANNFARNIQFDFLSKALLGTWLLLLMVLGSFYQSDMASHTVAPVFTKSPETFRQLAHSHYSKFAILWKNQLEREFRALRNDYSSKLMENVKEFSFSGKEVI